MVVYGRTDNLTRACAGVFYHEQAYLITISRPSPAKDKSHLHTFFDFAVIPVTLLLLLTICI